MAKFSSLTLMNGDKVISENDVVTTTKNGLMTPEMYQALLEASQGSASTTISNKIEFDTTNSQTKIFFFTFTELGISGPTIGQIIDNEGLVRDDLIISAYWTSSGLTINLTQIDDLTGTWKFIYAAPKASTSFVGGLKRVITSSNATAQSGNWYLCSGNITVTLPASSSPGDVVKVSSVLTANNVSIVPSGTDTIESQTGFNIDVVHGSVELVYDGSMWIVAEVVVN